MLIVRCLRQQVESKSAACEKLASMLWLGPGAAQRSSTTLNMCCWKFQMFSGVGSVGRGACFFMFLPLVRANLKAVGFSLVMPAADSIPL